jgi:hypothetical protein
MTTGAMDRLGDLARVGECFGASGSVKRRPKLGALGDGAAQRRHSEPGNCGVDRPRRARLARLCWPIF